MQKLKQYFWGGKRRNSGKKRGRTSFRVKVGCGGCVQYTGMDESRLVANGRNVQKFSSDCFYFSRNYVIFMSIMSKERKVSIEGLRRKEQWEIIYLAEWGNEWLEKQFKVATGGSYRSPRAFKGAWEVKTIFNIIYIYIYILVFHSHCVISIHWNFQRQRDIWYCRRLSAGADTRI